MELHPQAPFRVWFCGWFAKDFSRKFCESSGKPIAHTAPSCSVTFAASREPAVSWWNYPNMGLHLHVAVCQIILTDTVYMQFERVSAAQITITTPRKKNLGDAKVDFLPAKTDEEWQL